MVINYYENVVKDIEEAKKFYPFIHVTCLPTTIPREITLKVIVASAELIKITAGCETDFLGPYTKEVFVRIPYNYKYEGCIIEGAPWINTEKICPEDRHFYKGEYFGFRFCLGVPESFAKLENVLLENLKTVDNMMVAYERLLRGADCSLSLKAYSHGKGGIAEYRSDRKRYKG